MSKLLKIRAAQISTCLVLICCLWLSTKASAEDLLNGIVVVNQEGITDIAYQKTSGLFQKRTHFNIEGLIAGAVSEDAIFVATKTEVIKFDKNLQRLSSRSLKDIEKLATDSKNVFLCAENSFICLDNNLNELSRVELICGGYKKNAHSIVIYNQAAYLLDNLMFPRFILKIDISDVYKMRITRQIEITGINQHLNAQWLNPQLDQWIVVQIWGHKIGAGENLVIYSLTADKEEPLAVQQIFNASRLPQEKQEGFRIMAVTPVPPLWAIIKDAQENPSLARLDSDAEKIEFIKIMDLNSTKKQLNNWHDTAIVKLRNNLLIFAYECENLIAAVDILREPKLLFSQSFRDFNVRAIIDIFPY